jgi:hypothetical protein
MIRNISHVRDQRTNWPLATSTPRLGDIEAWDICQVLTRHEITKVAVIGNSMR